MKIFLYAQNNCTYQNVARKRVYFANCFAAFTPQKFCCDLSKFTFLISIVLKVPYFGQVQNVSLMPPFFSERVGWSVNKNNAS